MPTDRRALANWQKGQHAYDHYVAFIKTKTSPYALTFADLVFVANFKGGSAIVAEPVGAFSNKIAAYQSALIACSLNPAFRVPLGQITSTDYPRVRQQIVDFAGMTKGSSRISGFGPSFASTLLHFHFPLTVPILDKRALNGAGVSGIVTDRHNNVKNLLQLYPNLIDAFYAALRLSPSLNLRDLDHTWFVEQLRCPPFRPPKTTVLD